jgi:hypothetical protein
MRQDRGGSLQVTAYRKNIKGKSMLLENRTMHDRNSSAGALERLAFVEPSRMDRLVQYADYCESAKKIAESMGDTFLAYMMSMSIQAARTEMKPKIASATR